MPGQFDFWFDGGAGCLITGWTDYHFADGTRATVGVTPLLRVSIRFLNGHCISVSQVREEKLEEFIRAEDLG
jgi:hypothetical protein